MPTLKSALYVGHVRHRRYFPHANDFSYPIYLSYLDVDELDQVFRGHWLFSVGRRNVVSFQRKDYLGPIEIPLKLAVWQRVFDATGENPGGPVRVLSHLRHFGLSFNPVTFYYCFELDGETLHSIVAEITNTPWKERFAYVLPAAKAQRHGSALWWDFDKEFHVSPFLPMDMKYSWRFQVPTQNLRVHMQVDAHEISKRSDSTNQKQFDSTLVLQRQEITNRALANSLLHFPWITLGVVWKIYWQALKIKWKRNPFYDHPKLKG